MTIAIDVDGVLRNFVEQLKKIYLSVYPDHKIKKIKEYGLEKAFPIGKDIYYFFREKYYKEIFLYAEPYNGAEKFINNLEGNVIITTNQDTLCLRKATLDWLDCYNFKYNSIFFTNEKHLINADILIDDCTDILRKFPNKSICFDRSWNRDYVGTRVKSFKELNNIINKLRLKYDN